jgi:hypothetical protein
VGTPWLWPTIVSVLCSVAGALLVNAWAWQRKEGQREQQMKAYGEAMNDLREDLEKFQDALNSFGRKLAAATGVENGFDYRKHKGEL